MPFEKPLTVEVVDDLCDDDAVDAVDAVVALVVPLKTEAA